MRTLQSSRSGRRKLHLEWGGPRTDGRREEEAARAVPVKWLHVSLCTIPCYALYLFNFSSEPHFIDEEAKAQERQATCPKAALGTRIKPICPQNLWQGTGSGAGLL